jgi:GxxExxY protein
MDSATKREIIGKSVLDAAFRVHRELGPGLLECVYESALALELNAEGHRVERQKPIPVFYRGILLAEVGFRADLIVDSMVLIELKSVMQLAEVHKKTTWNYLRFTSLQLGFLLNFNEALLSNGMFRITNGAEGKPFFGKPQNP